MKKYENFCAALNNMKEIYKYEPPYNTVVLTGLVGLYELSFEQSWKMMKEILENHGFEEGATGSPKIILKTAYKAGMIKDEKLWLSALQERNNVAHSYNEKIAMDIVTKAKNDFYRMFCDLKEEIEENWLEFQGMESPCPIQIQEENEAKKERVFILSAFPEFLVDYFGIKLWKTCVKHRRNQLETHLCKKEY